MTVFTIAILAGFFGGAAAILSLTCFALYRELRSVHIERKRWINKSLVRDGQTTVFPDSEIEPQRVQPKKEHQAPMTMQTPLARKQAELRNQVRDGKREEAGQNLPDAVKAKIVEAAQNRAA